jgi:hypothetical protein
VGAWVRPELRTNIGNVVTVEHAVAALDPTARIGIIRIRHDDSAPAEAPDKSRVAPRERLAFVKRLSLDPPARADFRRVCERRMTS